MELAGNDGCLFGMERANTSTMMTNSNRRADSDGFTLVEVMVAMLVAALLSAGVIHSVILVKNLNQANEQRTVAFNLCKSKLEAIVALDYEAIPDFTTENNLPMTHLGEVARNPLTGIRYTWVTPQTTPIEHKEVRSAVVWTFRDKTLFELATATVYRK